MNNEVKNISVNDIMPNRFQPRKNFDQEALNELADSIRQHGIIQPLVLRKLGEKFEIITGERRYKAANMLGLKTVPAIIMEIDDASSAEIALVENVQRKDLTAIEEAKSYQKILELGQMNQDELAKRVGKKQSTVSNKLRLLNLSEEAQQALLDNKISERHARSLLRLKDKSEQNNMLNKIIDNRMTVRETDMEIKNILGENVSEADDYEILDFQLESTPDVPTNIKINEEKNIDVQPESTVFINPMLVPESSENNIQEPPIMNNNITTLPPLEPILSNQNIPEYDQIGINQNNFENQQDTRPIMGKFFNLDDEAANMNVDNTFVPYQNNYFNPEQFTQNGVPNFNEHQQSFTPQPENIVNTAYNTNPEPINPKPIMAQQDITGAVAILRNTVANLQNNGYMVDINESDSESSHQIIINIQK